MNLPSFAQPAHNDRTLVAKELVFVLALTDATLGFDRPALSASKRPKLDLLLSRLQAK